MEKQIKKTNTEFEDTNQKNLSVISELGEYFCFIIITYVLYCVSSVREYLHLYYYQPICCNVCWWV